MAYFDGDDTERETELTDDDLHERYDDMLNEVYGDFMNLLASRILKETDPIAYRVGFSDWLDAEEQDGAIIDSDNDDL